MFLYEKGLTASLPSVPVLACGRRCKQDLTGPICGNGRFFKLSQSFDKVTVPASSTS